MVTPFPSRRLVLGKSIPEYSRGDRNPSRSLNFRWWVPYGRLTPSLGNWGLFPILSTLSSGLYVFIPQTTSDFNPVPLNPFGKSVILGFGTISLLGLEFIKLWTSLDLHWIRFWVWVWFVLILLSLELWLLDFLCLYMGKDIYLYWRNLVRQKCINTTNYFSVFCVFVGSFVLLGNCYFLSQLPWSRSLPELQL